MRTKAIFRFSHRQIANAVFVSALIFLPTQISAQIRMVADADSVRISNSYLDAKISLHYPGFHGLSLDSLGKEHFPVVNIDPPPIPWNPVEAVRRGARIEYRKPGASGSTPPRWAIEVKSRSIELESRWSPDDPPEAITLRLKPSSCHITLLGLINPDGSIRLPALMHLPDQGSFRISATPGENAALGYASQKKTFVRITFPGATKERPVVKYRWEVESIHPKLAAPESDTRFDGFRRNWLNSLQISPQWRSLANHSSSDTCGFVYYKYADIARLTPPLAKEVRALDLIRQSLERIIGGAKAYGMPGYGDYPEFSLDTYPSLLIAACEYVQGTNDKQWLATNYTHLKSWTGKMLATDRNGNGLIEYILSGNSGSWPERLRHRPSNWWDTIGFGHEDAYANALAYRALRGMETLAALNQQRDDAKRFGDAAGKLKSAYVANFFNPATGVLAGWKSADGELHDYYFLWLNGIAIHYGLVPKTEANQIMDRLLARMNDAGYTRFELGLPGNLIPVLRKDYVHREPRWGGGRREDNADGFQIYENGGATACFAYFTLAALYDLGRIEDADRILFPMLSSFAASGFQGRCENGMSKDWKAWDGTCWGYEGFLVDNYYALLAVLDRDAAIKRKGQPAPGF